MIKYFDLQGRLNGLTILAIYKSLSINPEDVLNELALEPRRLKLIL